MTIKSPPSAEAICTECGGLEFNLAEFRRFRADTYSSTIGGELQPISEPIHVGVCMCGAPFEPRTARPASKRSTRYRDFADSLAKAIEARSQRRLEERVFELCAALANQSAVQELHGRLEALDELLKAIEQRSRRRKRTSPDATSDPGAKSTN